MRTERCPNCGASLSPDANYCSECGEAVNDDSWSDSSPEHAPGRRPEGDTTLAAITHVLAILTWAIGPLIVLVATEDPFVEENARNALHWQIAFTIYMTVSFFLTLVVVGVVPLLVLPVVDLVFCVLAAIKAADGEAWSYPATPDIV